MTTRTIGILSPGDMGSGLGRLLKSHSIRVVTNLQGRSPRTQELAKSNGIEDVGTDANLLSSAEIIISVLVPSLATSTASRIATAVKQVDKSHRRTKFYIDANAIAPATTKEMKKLFVDTGITFIDGSIIGGPPRLKPDGTWYKPTFALSGPGTRDVNLDQIFDISHVGPEIGQASALKMSFASLTKVSALILTVHEFIHLGIYGNRYPVTWNSSSKRAP
jgi:3-hydroxyisobutyrate dehydrogenase-like beta-hydroxyacid dehydrogenase